MQKTNLETNIFEISVRTKIISILRIISAVLKKTFFWIIIWKRQIWKQMYLNDFQRNNKNTKNNICYSKENYYLNKYLQKINLETKVFEISFRRKIISILTIISAILKKNIL